MLTIITGQNKYEFQVSLKKQINTWIRSSLPQEDLTSTGNAGIEHKTNYARLPEQHSNCETKKSLHINKTVTSGAHRIFLGGAQIPPVPSPPPPVPSPPLVVRGSGGLTPGKFLKFYFAVREF